MPKTKFTGIKRVTLAVCETISQFNTGAANKVMVVEDLGVSVSDTALVAFRREDLDQVKTASKKVSVNSRYRRRKMPAQRS